MSIDINGLTLSDWLLILSVVPAGWFFVEYTILTKWWPDPLGWVTALYNLAVLGLLGLIVYAIFVGERVPEVWRFIFAAFLFTALWGKVVILHEERRKGRLEKTHRLLNKESDGIMTTPITAEPTAPEIWYKAKRVLRTAVATLLSALSIWAAIAVIAPDVLAELAKILPESWILWLTAVVAGITAVASALTRIMAIPGVNDFLTKIGLGSVPKSALEAQVVREPAGEVHVITTVAPDPKVAGNP
jgi:hypothetical protein